MEQHARCARRPTRAHRGQGIGLALAGGGPLGGIYEIGALLALADSIEGLDLDALDVYVGVSSGSLVAAGLANGLSPGQMYRLFIDDGEPAELMPELFLRPAVHEFRRRLGSVPRLAAAALAGWMRPPRGRGTMTALATMARAVPTGLFDNGAIDAFLAGLFSAPGRTNDFRRLRRKLFVVATDLDSGDSVVFGAPGSDRVPISRAVEASAALPGLFPPVAIEGAHYVDGALNKTLHASLALDQGIGLLLCVNPLVPFDARNASRRHALTVERLDHGGLPLVLAQTFRAIIHSRMRAGMDGYERDYPAADVVLFEPDRDDADMFFANLFSYAQRRRLCAGAYAKTRDNLRTRAASLDVTLRRHGLRLRRARLEDRGRTVARAAADPRPLHARPDGRGSVRQTTRDLAHALDALEHWLAAAR